MNKNNTLAQSLTKALLDNHNHCSLTSPVKKLNRSEFFREILGYIKWLDQMKVHTVFVMSSPSIEALCLCYAIILSNRVYIPIHRSTDSELIKIYLQEYQADLLVIEPGLASQLDYAFRRDLLSTEDQSFCYHMVNSSKTMSILPGIIFFTSGSTGKPKAIHYDYNTLNNYIAWCVKEFGLTPSDQLLVSSELSFIASLRPLFVPTLSSASTVFIEGQNAN